MIQIIFATNNQNKLKEVQAQLPDEIKLISLKDIGCYEDIPETQNTIEGNAIQKANYIKMKYNKDCFADDNGLEVMALNGAPGVHSARYAGPEKKAENNIKKLLKTLENEPNRAAQFKTVIALHYKGKLIQFEGVCRGEITHAQKGSGGFGYDPVFVPEGFSETAAELDPEVKNSMSHRFLAMQQMASYLEENS